MRGPILAMLMLGSMPAFAQDGAAGFAKYEVERMSAPVYVVFFTLAGAQLHLDMLALMAPYAITLVLIRIIALYIGVRVGGSLTGASPALSKHGWMGFISQAGVALTLAGLAKDIPDNALFPGAGDTFTTLVIAGIAIHEVIGPVMLKIGLGLAKEIPSDNQPSTPEQTTPVEKSADTSFEPDPDTNFTEVTTIAASIERPFESQSTKLNTLCKDWTEDLQGLIRDFLQGPLTRMNEEHQKHLKNLLSII